MKISQIFLFIVISLISSLLSSVELKNDPGELIEGTWESSEDKYFIWEFLEIGVHRSYQNNALISESKWKIVQECEGETADNDEDFAMLEVIYAENDKQCYVIQGINGVLTLLSVPQGRLLIFDRIEGNICPKDIPINRSVMTDFLEKSWWEPQRIETNTTNLSVSQIQSLADSVDSSVCESFNKQYEEALSQLHQTGGKAYNVSYYKAGQFYFVIIGVKQPENPDVVAHGTTYFDIYDSNINFVKGYAF